MKSYEDLIAITSEQDKQNFLTAAINEYKSSLMYRKAADAYEYFCKRNVTIRNFTKWLYTISGNAVPDNFSANYKFVNAFFPIFVRQEVSHLLGNGVTFQNEETKARLGDIDNQLFRLGLAACWGGVAYGFVNYDHIDIFKSLEFCPLFGEEDGALHAGIRFWQFDSQKPLRVTLYEEDGYTEYKYYESKWTVLQEKRAYLLTVVHTASGIVDLQGKNYPSFPIVPLWANEEHQTELEGLREKIDGYDLMISGLANDLNEAAHLYWVFTNAGGMSDSDVIKFLDRMKTLGAAIVDEDGSTAEAHTIDVPYAARQAGLQELRDSLYRDAMALDTDKISAGNITATAIEASYENLTLKCDAFEMCVLDFIKGVMSLLQIDDLPTFKRSRIGNQAEDTQMVLSANLDTETTLHHLPWISVDEIPGILTRMTREEADRYEITEEELTGEEPTE